MRLGPTFCRNSLLFSSLSRTSAAAAGWGRSTAHTQKHERTHKHTHWLFFRYLLFAFTFSLFFFFVLLVIAAGTVFSSTFSTDFDRESTIPCLWHDDGGTRVAIVVRWNTGLRSSEPCENPGGIFTQEERKKSHPNHHHTAQQRGLLVSECEKRKTSPSSPRRCTRQGCQFVEV